MIDNTKDFQDTLHEVLNKRLNSSSKRDKLVEQIMEKTSKVAGEDFQKLLKENLKPLSEEKVKKELKPKTDKVEVGEGVNVTAEVKSGADLEQVLKSEEKEKDEADINSSQNELTRREQLLKYMYESALDEYYTLKDKLYKYQVYDNDISLDDKNYIKLLRYENYLRKCDVMFKSTTGKYISNEDAQISEKENKYAYEASKSEKQIMKQHQNSLNEVDRLNDEIESKADEIIALNEQMQTGNVPDYEQRVESLEKDYIALNMKMSLLTPNILELKRQEDEKEIQDETTTRIVGTVYEAKKDKYVMDANVVRQDNIVGDKEEILENVAEREKNQFDNTNTVLASSYIDAAEVSLQKGDTDEARELVQKAKDVVGIKTAESIAEDRKTDFREALKATVSSGDDEKSEISNETDGIDKHLAQVAAGTILLSPVQAECAKTVYSPSERSANALAREAKEALEKEKGPKEKIQDRSR